MSTAPRRRGYPLKQALWSRLHWRQWEALTPVERIAYERYVEEQDNAKVEARLRGWWGKQRRKCAK